MEKIKTLLLALAVLLLAAIAAVTYYRKDFGRFQINSEGTVIDTVTGEIYTSYTSPMKRINVQTGKVTEIRKYTP